MKKSIYLLLLSGLVFGCNTVVKMKDRVKPLPSSAFQEAPEIDKLSTIKKIKDPEMSGVTYCKKKLNQLPGKKLSTKALNQLCSQTKTFDSCYSKNGRPIFHYEKNSRNPKKESRILTISLIHGDEHASGSVARSWMQRLNGLDPRNKWRVIPIANPDGLKNNTRTNDNGVDVNRNFATKDWDELALKYWKEKKKSDPRRYPGPSANSELETKCLTEHLEDFQPDFIISIHTPYGVLDFDGPKSIKFPKFQPLPWISLGNYPGSLGRYMWVDRNVPVLTIELKGESGVQKLEHFDLLQDISGTVALQAAKVLEKNRKDEEEHDH